MAFVRKQLAGEEEIKKTNAMWRMQGIAYSSPTTHVSAFTTTLIHYSGAHFVRFTPDEMVLVPNRAPGACLGNIHIHISHSKVFPAWFVLA